MTDFSHKDPARLYGTTILAVRKGDKMVMIGDGQVTMGNTVMKGSARKVRRIADGKVVAGFAGATADAFALFERLEEKLERYKNNLERAAVELTKDWRTDKYLQKLEAMLLVANETTTLVVTGQGDVLSPDHHVVAIGSGGNYALSAARSLYEYEEDAEVIARKAMEIAADVCIYTNANVTVEIIET